MLSELPYSTKDVSHGLRTHLAMNSTELPNYQTMDTSLWFSIKEALANESYQIDLAWLDVSPLLAKELKDAPMRIVRDLSEASVCSFKPKISEDAFLHHFGRHENWKIQHQDLRISYYQARFASMYWCSVRDCAVKSKHDCISIFRLPTSIVEVLAESSTSQIIDFCHGFPNLQSFELSCRLDDCLRVIEAFKHQPDNSQRLMLAKMLKSNHCACPPSKGILQ